MTYYPFAYPQWEAMLGIFDGIVFGNVAFASNLYDRKRMVYSDGVSSTCLMGNSPNTYASFRLYFLQHMSTADKNHQTATTADGK